MAKVSASSVRHGPFRWLIRLCGWGGLIGGIIGMITGSDMINIYMGGSCAQGIMMGIVCLVLDFLVSVTDPDKPAKKKSTPSHTATRSTASSQSSRNFTSQKTSSAADDVEKTYREILNLLPTDSNLPRLINQYGREELTRRVRQDEDFCQQIFMRTLSQDVLDFIHTHNLIASYKIILELLKGAQKKQQEAQAAARSGGSGSANSFSGNSFGGSSSGSSGNRGENYINSFDKYSK